MDQNGSKPVSVRASRPSLRLSRNGIRPPRGYVMLALRIGYGLIAALAISWLWTMKRRLQREAEPGARPLEARSEQPQQAALTDPLTGLGNRHYLQYMLTQFANGSGVSHAGPAAPMPSIVLMIVHLDFLKPINDVHGHQAGDAILAQVAEILRECCRAGDHAARWRGDEFVIAYLHADLSSAEVLAERVRSRVAKQSFRLGDGDVVR